jgi:hypothetical protein
MMDGIDVKKISPLVLRFQFADGTVGKVKFENSHLTVNLRSPPPLPDDQK